MTTQTIDDAIITLRMNAIKILCQSFISQGLLAFFFREHQVEAQRIDRLEHLHEIEGGRRHSQRPPIFTRKPKRSLFFLTSMILYGPWSLLTA